MLKYFHEKNSNEKVMWLLGGVVALALVFNGLSGLINLIKPRSYAGEIFGKRIRVENFQQRYQQNLTLARLRYGRMFNDLEPLLDLNDQTWDQLILLKEAKNQKITVSDKEVADTISEYEAFFRKGKFDQRLYSNIIRTSLQTTIETFEKAIRASLITEKLREHITVAVQFTDDQLRDEYKNLSTLSKLTYITINTDTTKTPGTISDASIQNYYNQHKHDFLVPPTIKVEYLQADFPKDGGVQKQVETKYKTIAIADKHKETPNLKTLAKKDNYVVHESNYFHLQEFNFPFGLTQEKGLKPLQSFQLLKRLFAMNIGELIEPIEWDKGYILIKLKEKRDAYIPELNEIKDDIVDILTQKLAKETTKNRAQEYLQKLQRSTKEKDFVTIAKELNLETQQTDLTLQQEFIFTLNIRPTSRQTLFALSTKKPVTLIETIKGYAIVHLDETKTPNMTKYEKDPQAFADRLIRERKEEFYNATIKTLHEKANLKRFPYQENRFAITCDF